LALRQILLEENKKKVADIDEVINRNFTVLNRAQYLTLESCLRTAALSCVPHVYMEPSRVEEIVLGALRDNLQTKEVSSLT